LVFSVKISSFCLFIAARSVWCSHSGATILLWCHSSLENFLFMFVLENTIPFVLVSPQEIYWAILASQCVCLELISELIGFS
jgi:hypothetical protein